MIFFARDCGCRGRMAEKGATGDKGAVGRQVLVRLVVDVGCRGGRGGGVSSTERY